MSSPFPYSLTQAVVAGVTSVVVATLVACGGGGSATTGSTATGSSAATYTGTVTGLGSIVVNGIRFSTSGADTTDADDPTQPFTQAFPLGATVTVKGDVDSSAGTGKATSIEMIGGVRGKVTAVDTTASTLVVSGHNVKVDANTVFQGIGSTAFSLATLSADLLASTPVVDYVEVYGTADANNVILATRIEKKDPTSLVFATKGRVIANSINTTTHQFQMLRRTGEIVTVDYTGATLLPTSATLADGVGVRVLSSADPASLSVIPATKVLIKSDKQVPGTVAKLRGTVSAVNGTNWTIGDVTVDVSQSPTLLGFSSLSQVTAGTVVRVAGTFSNNVLVAKVVESDDNDRDHDGGGVKLFGVATGVNTTARTFSVQGVTVTAPSNLTLPINDSYVEVVAQQVNGVLTAVVIRSSASHPFEVFGTAACTNGQSDLTGTFNLTLLDGSVSVDGSAATITTERNVSMAAATSGSKTCLLEVTGTLVSVNSVKTISATKIEVKRRF